jgi:predicted phosphodiesterase
MSSARINLGWLLFVVGLTVACTGTQTVEKNTEIEHSVVTSSQPWTKLNAGSQPGALRFAVFSDLTGGERKGIFEIAVEQLNLLRPELIVNVGDLIEGGTDDHAELDRQWESFDRRAKKARAPIFYTGGNHDLLSRALREVWHMRNGPRYYYFRYRDVLFLILDTEDHEPERLQQIAELRAEALAVFAEHGDSAARETEYANLPEDETGAISVAQSQAMVEAITSNSDVRWTFLLMHKAPWANDDMPSWQAIEQALGSRPYTVFHGHRHSYRHIQRSGRDYIRLATTGGSFASRSKASFDQIVWVTVDDEGAHIANLKMSGILDKTGRLPLDGDTQCLEWTDCQTN